jgi:5'/3'-nucleotidase
VALDELGLEPDLVVSGINKGQNVGPLAYASGTVGAGREAVRRGIPAIAGSAALDGDGYELAAQLLVEQIEEHRDEYGEASSGTVDAVVNINVPDCTAGAPKELVEVDLATEIPEGVNPFASDCSAASEEEPADDVLAVVAGHPALSLVPPEAPPG